MFPYKLSHYTVFTDPVNEKGDRIIFSTISCKTLLLSGLVYAKLMDGALNHIPAALTEKLIKNEILVHEDENELAKIIAENKQSIEEKSDTLFEVIQPSANCQLGCYYCGQDHSKKTLGSLDTDLLVERIQKKLTNSSYKNLQIGWFGGEPLLGLVAMRELSQRLIRLCEDHSIGYSAKVVTNGLSLKKNIFKELVTEMRVRQIEVTLDGVAKFHDIHRYTKEGGGSFHFIFQNLKDAIALKDQENYPCKISVRCNVDNKNQEGVSALIHYIADFELQKKIDFYTTGIYSWGGNEAHKKSLTKEEFAAREIGWKKEMIQRGYTSRFEIPKRKKIVCMVVTPESEMYDAYGNIFNCTETSYAKVYENTPYQLGNINTIGDTTLPRPHADWNDQIQQDDSLPCHTCKMLPVCGGACPKSWKEGNIACPSNKFNIKDKLRLNYQLSQMLQKPVPEAIENDYQNLI